MSPTDTADGIEVEGVAGRLIIVRCAALIPPLIPLCLRRSTSCYRRLSLSPMLPSSNTVSSLTLPNFICTFGFGTKYQRCPCIV